MLKSFVEADGVLALVQVVSASSSSLALGYTLELIMGLMHDVDPSPASHRGRKLAESFFKSGGCASVLHLSESFFKSGGCASVLHLSERF
jgi:hypothetical protein